jgi:septal ring factor EnvC (AmiA/AmiB activator)
MNKHRFGMFMELYRFLYDFLAMHLTIRKTYLEAFRNKCMQFIKFFDSVKDSKKRLHGDQNNHNWRLARSRDSIKKLQKVISEKHQNIKRKRADIKEIQEELSAVNEELEVVLNKKDESLSKMIDNLSRVPTQDFNVYGRQESN